MLNIELASGLKGAMSASTSAALAQQVTKSLPDGAKVLLNAYQARGFDNYPSGALVALAYYQYVHPDFPHDQQFIRYTTTGETEHSVSVTDFSDLIARLNALCEQQMQCPHTFARPCDPAGSTYPDGRGVCTSCGLRSRYAFLPRPGKIISMSYGEDYVSRCHWPDGTYVQGGAPHKREGAFVEAFPAVAGISTFIRADKPTVAEAEQAAYTTYQRYINCDGHQWSRMVHGKHRTDGYARCDKCNMHGSALSPQTCCAVCQTPTKHHTLGPYLCLSHYMAVPFLDRGEQKAREYAARGYLRTERMSLEQTIWRYTMLAKMEDDVYITLGDKTYIEHHNMISQILMFAVRTLLHMRYGVKGIRAIRGAPDNSVLPTPHTAEFDADMALFNAMSPMLLGAIKSRIKGTPHKINRATLWTPSIQLQSQASPVTTLI